jgi:hypothetical protein
MIHRLRRAAAINRLAALTGVGQRSADDVPPDLVIAEYLRRTINALAQPESTGGWKPVYVTTLTNQVRRQLAPVWPTLERVLNKRPSVEEQKREGDTLGDPVRRVLEALDDLREIAHLGRGYWLPTPLRFVSLPGVDSVLVVGGLSTSELRRYLHTKVTTSWIARVLDKKHLPADALDDRTRWQSFENWQGSPVDALQDWAREKMKNARRTLVPSASGVRDFEIYSPGLRTNQPQFFRWVPAREMPRAPTELLLCRASERGMFAVRRYWLGTTAGPRGALHAVDESPIDSKDVRRLQYALDQLSGFPTTVHFHQDSSATLFHFKSLLPPEERRLLIAFGKDESIRAGRLPQLFRFASESATVIQTALKRLGVRLVTR